MSRFLLNPVIAHLSETQVDELVSRYYAGENITILLAEFKIGGTANTFSRHLPQRIHESNICPACDAPMASQLYSRSSARRSKQQSLFCSRCEHIDSSMCRCAHCQSERQEAQLALLYEQQKQIREYCRTEFETSAMWTVENLSFRQAVSFLALVRTCELVDNATCEPLATSTIPLAPEGELGQELLAELAKANLINISERSGIGAFSFAGGAVTSYQYDAVRWNLLCENVEHLIAEIENCGLTGEWPISWASEVETLWMDLALAECKEYYAFCLRERGVPYTNGAKTDSMLRNLLRDNSVAQCYRIIWAGAQRTADFLIRKKPSLRHAANFMVGACLRWADWGRAEGLETKCFRRNFHVPRSMVSYVLHDVMLKIGEMGFTDLPRRSARQT